MLTPRPDRQTQIRHLARGITWMTPARVLQNPAVLGDLALNTIKRSGLLRRPAERDAYLSRWDSTHLLDAPA
jgi:hypothetical protein